MRRLAAVVPALIALLAFTPAANAHGFRPVGPAEGIRIESLTHGQMAVLARYRGQIMNLAASRTDTDEPFRRVMNYASIQFSVSRQSVMRIGVPCVPVSKRAKRVG